MVQAIMGVDPIYYVLAGVAVMITVIIVMGLVMVRMVNLLKHSVDLLGGIHNETIRATQQAKAFHDSGPLPVARVAPVKPQRKRGWPWRRKT